MEESSPYIENLDKSTKCSICYEEYDEKKESESLV